MLRSLLLVLVVTSCSALDFIKPGGVNANAQIGKENTQQVVGTQEETSNDVEGDQVNSEGQLTTNGSVGVINNQPVPLWMVVLAVVGWMAPSPAKIYKEIKS